MDFTNLLANLQDNTEIIRTGDILFSTTLSFLLALVIASIYKATYKGVSYTQSYVYTLIMMSMVVSIIMLIVGSNITRAFALIGALSIIRFRNAINDPRDVGYIFLAIVVGMATGTRFYLVAVVATLVISYLLWGIASLNMFAKDVRKQILKVRIPGDMPYETLFDHVFARYLNRFNLIAVEVVQAGLLRELIYRVELKKQGDAQDMMQELNKLNNNNKVTLITGSHEIDL